MTTGYTVKDEIAALRREVERLQYNGELQKLVITNLHNELTDLRKEYNLLLADYREGTRTARHDGVL